MRKIIFLSSYITISLFLMTEIVAQIPPGCTTGQEFECFDNDGDGKLSENELKVFFYHTRIKTIDKNTDKNFDGRIDNDYTPLEAHLIFLRKKFNIDNENVVLTKDQFLSAYPIKKKIPLLSLPILVRENSEDVTPYGDALDIDDADPALFSFGRDYFTNENTWVAKGAIMYNIIDTTYTNKNDERLFIFPSIAFNRVWSPDPTKEANSLIFRMGSHYVFIPEKIIEVHALRFYVNYGTDFAFQSKQAGLELEWEPLFRKGPFGHYKKLGPQSGATIIEWRITAFLRAESGYVFEAGNKENLEDDDGFIRAGGKGKIDIRVLKNIKLSGDLTYLKGISGKIKESQLNTLSASYSLDEKDQVSIKLEYQKGNILLTQEEVENLLLGFAIKL